MLCYIKACIIITSLCCGTVLLCAVLFCTAVLLCCYSVGFLVLCCLTLCCVVWWLICEYVLCCIMCVALFVVLRCIVCTVLVLLSGGQLCCFVLHCAVLCCLLCCIVWHYAEHVGSVGFYHNSYIYIYIPGSSRLTRVTWILTPHPHHLWSI